MSAAESSTPDPLERSSSTLTGSPSVLTSTRRVIVPCSPLRRADAGYAGGGLRRYAARKSGGVALDAGEASLAPEAGAAADVAGARAASSRVVSEAAGAGTLGAVATAGVSGRAAGAGTGGGSARGRVRAADLRGGAGAGGGGGGDP